MDNEKQKKLLDEENLSEEERIKIEKKVIEAIEEIRPILQMDGGDLEFIGMEGLKVKVRLTGTCHGCPYSAYTLQLGVEAHIKERVPEIKEIVNVP